MDAAAALTTSTVSPPADRRADRPGLRRGGGQLQDLEEIEDPAEPVLAMLLPVGVVRL